MVVLDTIIEGTMSQIIFLGPRLNVMQFRKLGFEKLQKFSVFGHKIKKLSLK